MAWDARNYIPHSPRRPELVQPRLGERVAFALGLELVAHHAKRDGVGHVLARALAAGDRVVGLVLRGVVACVEIKFYG